MTIAPSQPLLDLVRDKPGRTACELAALAGVDQDTILDELTVLLWHGMVEQGPERASRVDPEDKMSVWYASEHG